MYEYKILKQYYVKKFLFFLSNFLSEYFTTIVAAFLRVVICKSQPLARLSVGAFTAQARSDCDRCVVQNVECATVTHLSSPRPLGKQETGAEATIPTGHAAGICSGCAVLLPGGAEKPDNYHYSITVWRTSVDKW